MVGTALFLQGILIVHAMPLTFVAYVLAVKRLTILFSVVWGGLLLKEGFFGRRLISALLMVVGVIVIILFGGA